MFLVLESIALFRNSHYTVPSTFLKIHCDGLRSSQGFSKASKGDSAKRTQDEPSKLMILKKLTIRY